MLKSFMAESEKIRNSRQVANELGITQQMLSKYTQAYLQISGTQIPKQGRNGRQYSAAHFLTLQNARDWVRFNTGATVEEAVRRAVTFADTPLKVPARDIEARNDTQALREALREEVAGPIVEKLEALQREIAELKEVQMAKIEEKAVEEEIEKKSVQEELSSIEADSKTEKVGTFTNIGTFLDRFLNRFRGS